MYIHAHTQRYARVLHDISILYGDLRVAVVVRAAIERTWPAV